MTSHKSREGRGWPGYIFGGRLRTSTAALLIAFFAIWWLYDTYQPAPEPPEQVPASDVVPPGFIPDPAYTWAPRTDVQPRTTTPTTTTSGATTTPTTTGETPPDPDAPATTPPTSPGLPTNSAPPTSAEAPAPEPSASAVTPVPTTTGALPAPAAPAR